MEERFRKLAHHISAATGTAGAFFLALTTILVWLITGPLLQYSDSWQLTINTLTTITTFLMVFLIQNTQNRDAKTNDLKLDELLRAVKGTRPKLINTDELSDDELEELHQDFIHKSQKYAEAIARRKAKLAAEKKAN